MWHQRARLAVAVVSILVGACGDRTDSSLPDGGTTGAGATSGSGGGGAAGASGTGGRGGATPDAAPEPFITPAKGKRVSKIDVLFMIDNSSSMADKHEVLSSAVPELVERLIDPKCVDPRGKVVGSAVNGVCATGVLDFEPVKDIHIGIISSSLGSHGAAGVCDDAIDASVGRSDPHNNDQAHLIARGVGGTTVPTFNHKGFLNYNPAVAGALTSWQAVAAPFTDMIKGVGQHGCGYEASLEAVYRFLIEPEPHATIRIDTSVGGFGQALLNGTDMQLLQQRADFLRPDSLVSVVLVSDENDCSIIDGGQGFYPILPPVPGTGRSVLKSGTSKCAENPNDRCCFNCGQFPPPGCNAPDTDPACTKGELLVVEDQPNIRCFDQKRRYGVDFLYPVQRYIDGFREPLVPNRRGEMVKNPLFSDLTCATCPGARDENLVLVTGIVGVPWRDIAVNANDLAAGYKTARQLDADGVWADIVGDPSNPEGPIAPRDPHMVESIKPRAGLPGPGSAPGADVTHGHEWDPSKDQAQPNADLQYACTYELASPRTCTQAMDCDCFGPHVAATMNPLCQDARGAYTSTQVRAKAYPGTRFLQVLRGLGDQAVVGSICPAQTVNPAREDFGYSPAIRATIDRLRRPLREPCLSVALPMIPASAQTACTVIEIFNAATCDCANEPGRTTARDELITDEMRMLANCFCEILQLAGDAQNLCRSTSNPPGFTGDGWCYVDPAQQSEASCDVVSVCAPDQQRRIRFMNSFSEPRPSATAYLRCDVQPISPLPARCP